MFLVAKTIISKDSKTPLCQQFDSFFNALLNSLWKKRNLDVYVAIYRLEPKTIERIASEAETVMMLSIPGDFTKEKCFDNMDEETEEKNASERHTAYESEIKNLFGRIMSKLDMILCSEISSSENWEEISREKDTINLLKTLRKVCYGFDKNPTSVTYYLDKSRFIDQFVGCTQKKGQRIDDFIAEIESYYNVLKVHGNAETQSYYNVSKVHGKRGGTFCSELLIRHTIQNKFKKFQNVEFDSLCDDDKRRIEKVAGRIVLATAIVQGSKPSCWKNHRIRKYAKIAGTPPQSGLEVNDIATGLRMCAAW